MTRLRALLLTPIAALLAVLVTASPAAAAVTVEQKLAALSSFTQTSVTSYNAWNSARLNQGAWGEYQFNWSTDYCSSSPDNPLGFDFRLACYRHDFGYRNHKDMGQFTSTNKDRVDSAFYEDMKRKCASYNWAIRPVCTSLAWTYYQAVKTFGNTSISSAELERHEKMLRDAKAKAKQKS